MSDLKILIKNSKVAKLITEDKSIILKISKLLSYKKQGVEYTQAYKNGWDGIVRLLNKKNEFGIGLLDKVKKYLDENSIAYEIEDKRKKPKIEPELILNDIGFSARDYQQRIVEACKENTIGIVRAATGSGKCISKDSLNITEKGILSFEELKEIYNLNVKEKESTELNLKLATPLTNNNKDTSSHFYYDGVSESIKITTKYGYSITGTPNHRIKIINTDGKLAWKKLSEISEKDYVAISYNTQMFGSNDLDLDTAYWYGLLIGDGGLTTKGVVTLTNMDKHILDFGVNYLNKLNIKYKLYNTKSKAKSLNIYSTSYRKELYDYGFKYCKSINKEIPKNIRMLKKEPLAMFIRGIYETDGWVESRSICLGLSNEKLIDQIQTILLNFGIVASKRMKKTSRNDCFILTIYNEFIPKFMNEIGLDPNGHKIKKVNFTNKNFNLNVNCVPFQRKNIKSTKLKPGFENTKTIKSWGSYRNPSKANLEKYLDNCEEGEKVNEIKSTIKDKIFLKVSKIEKVISDNYDFCIPETHSFVSNGFINHNTFVSAQIVKEFNKPTIIYVIGLDLLQQFHDLYSKLFKEEIGWIGNGICNPKRITIASVWTLGSALEVKKESLVMDDESIKELPPSIKDKFKILQCLKEAKVHIIDECHACTCDTLQQIYKYIDPERIYGLSGTPFRDDGSDLLTEAMLGKIICNVSASELIEKKVLAQPVIKFVNVPHQTIHARTFQEVYKEYIVNNDIRNALIVRNTKYLIEKKYKPLVLFKTIEHGKKLYNEFINEGINCELLYGNDSLEKRNIIKQKLNDGEIDCIIASTIFDIGMDLPKLSALVLCGGGKSKVRTLQRIGRVIRAYKDKTKAAIVDFMDNVRFLDNHSKIRYETYIQEPGFKILGN